ncbi:unnamed protein product [Lota lota]
MRDGNKQQRRKVHLFRWVQIGARVVSVERVCVRPLAREVLADTETFSTKRTQSHQRRVSEPRVAGSHRRRSCTRPEDHEGYVPWQRALVTV